LLDLARKIANRSANILGVFALEECLESFGNPNGVSEIPRIKARFMGLYILQQFTAIFFGITEFSVKLHLA